MEARVRDRYDSGDVHFALLLSCSDIQAELVNLPILSNLLPHLPD